VTDVQTVHILITAVSAATAPSGICRHAANLARCAISREEVTRVTLIVGSWQENYFKNLFALRDPKLVIACVDISNNSLARNIWYLLKLPQAVKSLDADMVHLSFPVPIWRDALKCPVVTTVHDLYPYDEPSNFGYPRVLVNRLFFDRCMRAADSVICVSETTRARLSIHDPIVANKKSIVIYNCIDITSVGPCEGASAYSEGYPFILMVAQHRSNKNILLAVKAFERLLQKSEMGKRIFLLILGNVGPETAVIMQSVRQQVLRKNVRLLSGMTDAELIWLYKNCEVVIAPSSNEGFGLPVAEGLLCGSRVVCSDIPVFREIGGKACHYFDLRATSPSSAMTDAILDAWTDQAGRMEHPGRFAPESIGKNYVAHCLLLRSECFQEMIENREVDSVTGRLRYLVWAFVQLICSRHFDHGIRD
jgi:glycosyltransferase involved in cell wall biosynthesis